MEIFKDLIDRGLIAQCTNLEKVEEILNNKSVTFYIGFDATADSLHVGHFLQLIIISRLLKAGHKPIILLGGGTTMVGDPTGKTDMRRVMSKEEIDYNVECFKTQISKIVDITNVTFINNADWLLKLNYIEFLRDIGSHFTVNRMLSAECFKSRYERGLSFIEFNYMIMQSYDYLELYKNNNCIMQLGGNDQWANILSGVDLIRRKENKEVYGLTFNLLTTKEGKKMGKTESGAIWLDEKKTSPYEFFQYWRNVNDEDVINLMKMLTFIPLEEIYEYEKSDINYCKEKLAFELTKQVHSEQKAIDSLNSSKGLFNGDNSQNLNIPSLQLKQEDFVDGKINILDLLVLTKLTKSKSEGRTLINQGGICIDNKKIEDIYFEIDFTSLNKKDIIIKKGKKVFFKVYK